MIAYLVMSLKLNKVRYRKGFKPSDSAPFYVLERRKKNMELTKEEKELILKTQREYKREWRRKNPGKVRESNNRYWLKKANERKKGGN